MSNERGEFPIKCDCGGEFELQENDSWKCNNCGEER